MARGARHAVAASVGDGRRCGTLCRWIGTGSGVANPDRGQQETRWHGIRVRGVGYERKSTAVFLLQPLERGDLRRRPDAGTAPPEGQAVTLVQAGPDDSDFLRAQRVEGQ